MKTCNKCSKEKPLDSFFKDKGNKTDGRYSICKECKSARTMEWRAKNKPIYNEYMRAKNKEHYPKNRLQRYGLVPAQYEEMLTAQEHKCAICKQSNPSEKRALAIDHDHKTGKVRGILCYGCNRLMVLLDNEALLAAAVAYKNKA